MCVYICVYTYVCIYIYIYKHNIMTSSNTRTLKKSRPPAAEMRGAAPSRP